MTSPAKLSHWPTFNIYGMNNFLNSQITSTSSMQVVGKGNLFSEVLEMQSETIFSN